MTTRAGVFAALLSGTFCALAQPLPSNTSKPSDTLPQPYRTIRDWAELPGGKSHGPVWPASVTAVEAAKDGTLFVIYRCFENSCAGRPEAPIVHYDKSGKVLASWGAGKFVFPHGSTLDAEGNLWVTDAAGDGARGHQVHKFSPDGRLLLSLGKAGVAGSAHDTFDQPCDVAVARDGTIFVADGHRNGQTGATGNNRIVVFSRDGTYLREWGRKGTGPGEMREPHSIALDSRGRVFVADRVNNRIQIFDQKGKYLAQWTQFGRPSAIAIAGDTIYVTDSETGPDTGANETTGWKKGIRIGSARDGKVTAFIEDMEPLRPEHSGAEGIGVDSEGNVYGAVVRRRMLEKHVPAARAAGANASAPLAPRFEVDPFWPKPLPNHWVLGQTIGVSADARGHIWIVHRPASLEPGEVHATTNPPVSQCCVPAPPVLEFDAAGNLAGQWGGPGPGYDWPDSNHGITVDYKGNVWIGANGGGVPAPDASLRSHDSMILKFSPAGRFLLQIGKPFASQGSNDVENLRHPAKIFVDPKRNEAYVADGYANHRVIVFDADTGRYKRHWGAYGNKPSDENLGPYRPGDPPAKQFRNPVHCAMLSHDDLLYVCDRANDRIQVFQPDGAFVKEAFIETSTLGSGSVWDIAFSADPRQTFLYVADGENRKVHILRRDTLEVLTSFGDGGQQPGQFYGVHSIATDGQGNLYTTETYRGQRVQKFVFKGLAPVTAKDQGVLWPAPSKPR